MAELFPTRGLPHNEAHLSPCGLYRFRLWRSWGDGRRQACWIALNPSTADATFDDPTLKRMVSFSKSWGHDGLVVVNLCPHRTSKPSELPDSIPAAIAERNRELVLEAAAAASLVVVAWGNGGAKLGAVAMVEALTMELHCLGVTGSGAPKHPLARGKHRVPEGTRPQLWRRP